MLIFLSFFNIKSLVVDYGAMLNLLSINNETPEDLARMNNSIDCLKLISSMLFYILLEYFFLVFLKKKIKLTCINLCFLEMLDSGKITASSQEDWLHENISYLVSNFFIKLLY